jgi:RNA polymerase sigma factor (TIGR02999 family)
MSSERRGELSILLDGARAGGADARDRLVATIYSELRRIARGLMHHERPGHTLQPSALVHEALLRLLDGHALAEVPNRRCLFAAASQTMWQVLVNHARRRRAAKRGGERARVPLNEALVVLEEQALAVE